jgi:predicted NAD/FAD-binding protein
MTGRNIAVIGGGISGLTAGYVLSRTDDVTLFEADGRLGGHADTHLVVPAAGPSIPVDTGFIVYNERTYPLLTRLFAELGVATQPSEMSMSVSCAGCGLQYAGHRGLAGVTAGLSRGRGRYLRMLTEIPRFHRAARHLLASGTAAENLTFGEFLADGGYSDYFTAHFALPLVAAVWSCPPGTALSYPAGYLFAFLANHRMLAISGSPPWRTVTGGSRSYVERIAKRLHSVRISTPVRAVHRDAKATEVRTVAGESLTFDAIVIATHPGQALRMLASPTQAERDVLSAFGYTPNQALLHTDARLLPRRRAARASWNYELSQCHPTSKDTAAPPRISYHMNRLQSLPAAEDYLVTLGGAGVVDPRCVIDRMDYEHPAYTPASVAAQRRLPELNTAVMAFAGAYHGWGFHEDGCRSGAEAARALGGTW